MKILSLFLNFNFFTSSAVSLTQSAMFILFWSSSFTPIWMFKESGSKSSSFRSCPIVLWPGSTLLISSYKQKFTKETKFVTSHFSFTWRISPLEMAWYSLLKLFRSCLQPITFSLKPTCILQQETEYFPLQ